MPGVIQIQSHKTAQHLYEVGGLTSVLQKWSWCPRLQSYYKTPKPTPPLSQGLLKQRQDLTSPKLWRGDSKLTSFSLAQWKPSLGRDQPSVGEKDQHSPTDPRKLLTNHLKPWQWHSRLHRQEESALGEQKSSHVGALPPGMLKAALRWEIRKMGEGKKIRGNLFTDRERLIWWKPQTRARLRSQEASCWGLRGWAGVTAVTRNRKALTVISGHGRLKEN